MVAKLQFFFDICKYLSEIRLGTCVFTDFYTNLSIVGQIVRL